MLSVHRGQSSLLHYDRLYLLPKHILLGQGILLRCWQMLPGSKGVRSDWHRSSLIQRRDWPAPRLELVVPLAEPVAAKLNAMI